jgi:TonB family protein
LRDQTETGPPNSRSVTTITYTTIEREPVLPESLFQFDTPGGGHVPILAPDRPAGEARVYHVGEVSAPVPIRVVKASYTEEARRLRISGTVELSVQIDTSGIPANIKVIRGLGHGLDEKAIEAVTESRFRPTLKDGRPVIVEITVGVGFDLN